jgi:transcriptional regulator with GAF, ATPase, and Fis domain
LDALADYGLPGNIRELQIVLERSVILTGGIVRTRIMKALEEANADRRVGRRGGPPGAEAHLISIALASFDNDVSLLFYW